MIIELTQKTVAEVFDGFKDSEENGVVGYGGKLNIRPAFQREYIYDDKRRNAVIDTVQKNFPLNVMYWVEDEEGNYELLDGQQRTLSICRYVAGSFSINGRAFHNLTETEREDILKYPLMIYICKGNDKEKLDWFKIINIGSVQLTDQELRNAIYTGPWLSDAKRYFSKTNCAAYGIGGKYLTGEANRQAYLESALEWLSSKEGITIEEYMGVHQHDSSASPLWLYFQQVISWVQTIFPKYRKEMKGIKWGLLYNKYGEKSYDPSALEAEIKRLMEDDDVSAKKGVYEYLLSGEEKHLHIREFTPAMKRQAYERQNGICRHCQNEGREKIHYDISEMEADHIIPWSKGGPTNSENCEMICDWHNRHKSNK